MNSSGQNNSYSWASFTRLLYLVDSCSWASFTRLLYFVDSCSWASFTSVCEALLSQSLCTGVISVHDWVRMIYWYAACYFLFTYSQVAMILKRRSLKSGDALPKTNRKSLNPNHFHLVFPLTNRPTTLCSLRWRQTQQSLPACQEFRGYRWQCRVV